MNEHDITLRQTMITGTDATAIVGLNSFRTIADVYLAKKYPQCVERPTGKKAAALDLGNRYEPIIAELYSEKLGCDIFKPEPKTFCSRMEKYRWLGGSPDYLWAGNKRGVECKKISESRYWNTKSQWGAEGTDQVPHEILLQCSHYMMLCGIKEWDVAALIGDYDFRIYRLYADKELCMMLLDKEEEFYQRYVEGNEEPHFGDDEIANFIKAKYPTNTNDKVIEVHPTDVELKRHLTNLLLGRELEKKSKAAHENYKVVIQDIMKDAGEITWKQSDDENVKPIRIDWKKTRDGTKVDWMTVAMKALDASALTPEQREQLVRDHSEVKHGARRFAVYGEPKEQKEIEFGDRKLIATKDDEDE